eukprot:INCI5048.22.p1 GENE.INCI5048.22~~INCI5048.22.p1  ORF type:complete len:630 (-),score=88.21 INCI5048.22:2185-4074(-)
MSVVRCSYLRGRIVCQAAFHWTSPVSSRSLVSKSLAKVVDNIVHNKVQRATGGGEGAAGSGTSSSPAPEQKQVVRTKGVDAASSIRENPNAGESGTGSRLSVLLQPKILGILEVDVARLDKLGPKVGHTELFVMVSHCGVVYWTESVGARDNFCWSGGRHFRVPITDVTQDVQLQVFTVDKSTCIGQVIIPVSTFFGGLYASPNSTQSTWYRLFPLDESQHKFRSSAHNNRLACMVRPKADEPAHAGRLLLNTNFYPTNEYPKEALAQATGGWKAKLEAVVKSSPMRIMQSYFADECHFSPQTGIVQGDEGFSTNAAEARRRQEQRANHAAVPNGVDGQKFLQRRTLTTTPSTGEDAFAVELIAPRSNDFGIPTNFEVPHIREFFARMKGVMSRASALSTAAEAVRSWSRPSRSAGLLVAHTIVTLWAPVVTWPLVGSLCWGIIGFLAAAHNQRLVHEAQHRGICGWTAEDDEEAEAVAEATPASVLPPPPSKERGGLPGPPPPLQKPRVGDRLRDFRAKRRARAAAQRSKDSDVASAEGTLGAGVDQDVPVTDALWLDELGIWRDEVAKQAPLLQRLKMLQSFVGPLQVFLLRVVTAVEKVEALIAWHDPWVRGSGVLNTRPTFSLVR